MTVTQSRLVTVLALAGIAVASRPPVQGPQPSTMSRTATSGQEFPVSRAGASTASMVEGGRKVRTTVPLNSLPMSNYVAGFESASNQAMAALEHDAVATGTNSVVARDNSAPTVSDPKLHRMITEELRLSVVRIHMIETVVDWFQPFAEGAEQAAIGTGFAVSLTKDGVLPDGAGDDPTFVTNAHVVKNAHTLRVQLPAVGQMDFEAYCPIIYEDFDLALVKLADPAQFHEFLASQKAKLKVLPIKEIPVTMGLTVAAVGFPLGSETLKLSMGVVSGTEQVEGHLVFQSTAPISPGSSGGPLFKVGDTLNGGSLGGEPEVIGVNFAVSTQENAQNANYVVAAVHVRQLLHEYDRRMGPDPAQVADKNSTGNETGAGNMMGLPPALQKLFGGGDGAGGVVVMGGPGGSPSMPKPKPRRMKHQSLKFGLIGAAGIEANDVLYKNSGGCKSGVFISKIEEMSALRFGHPPVPEMAFMTQINGVDLDQFGMGRTSDFLGDPIPFENMMSHSERIETPVRVMMCKSGKLTQHNVSMEWRKEYEEGIQAITEPEYQKSALDYEYFADVTVMQMTLNHILTLIKAGGPVTLGRWLMPENTQTPRLIVVNVKAGTYASRILTPGMVLAKVNGHNVSTLADFRNAFEPNNGTDYWRLDTERGAILETGFEKALVQQLYMVAKFPQLRYMNTTAVYVAGARRNMFADASQGQTNPAEQLAAVFSRMLEEAYQQGRSSAAQQIIGNMVMGGMAGQVPQQNGSNASGAIQVTEGHGRANRTALKGSSAVQTGATETIQANIVADMLSPAQVKEKASPGSLHAAKISEVGDYGSGTSEADPWEEVEKRKRAGRARSILNRLI